MPDYLSVADFAITPVKPVPTKRYCTPIKDGEYWSIGLPVVITKDISDDAAIIEQFKAGVVLKSLTELEFQKAVINIEQLLKEDKIQLRKRISSLAHKFRNYNDAFEIYKKVYGSKLKEGIVSTS